MPRSPAESLKPRTGSSAGGARMRSGHGADSVHNANTSTHDITIPPTPQLRRDLDPFAPGSEAWCKERTETATFHGIATITLTSLLVVWTFARGAVPALDPRAGLLLLVLHLGACVTGWLAMDAVRDLRRERDPEQPALPGTITAFGSAGAISLLINTAMAFAALLP